MARAGGAPLGTSIGTPEIEDNSVTDDKIAAHTTTKITTPKSLIQTAGEFTKAEISATGTWTAAEIPNLNASKIDAGIFDAARIPNLNASKIDAGIFDAARIPTLAKSKISTTGTWPVADIPSGLNASVIGVGTLATARLGSGTADGTTFLRGDQTWAAPAAGGLTESAELSLDSPADTAQAFTTNGDTHISTAGTIGVAGKLYLITAIEIKNGDTSLGSVMLEVFRSDGNLPPTLTDPYIIAYSKEFTGVVSTTHKIEVAYSKVIRGGTDVFAAMISTANGSVRINAPASQNYRWTADTYNINPPINRTGITWLSQPRAIFSRIYYREYD